ncbi:MAG TPA: DUF58 domain-containing protein [Phycisphaerae bacterium]|nr:DUF58 domain-containing protein [Phycisphaerae bacterium]HPP28745.1 DUF58 domain-containing protein [Phycisphaerae bacterium]HPZ99424.1 DUF58 domain-containing protein [Phycisphaerae bacterium]
MSSAARYLRPDVIAQVQRLDLKARFIVEGFIAGLHNSPFQGFSVEFSEHRKYTAGDDLRQIDWSVYGRTDRFYIKKYDAETNLECHLLVDTSASMGYPAVDPGVEAGRMNKLDYAICLAAALGYLMINQQDAVGMARFDDRLRSYLPPKSKRTHLMRLIGELAGVKPAPDATGKGLAQAIHDVARRVRRRGLMIILSDLLADPDEVIQGLHHLRFRGHDVILFQVLDETEVRFPFDRLSEFVDPETGRRLIVHPQAVRERYLAALREFTARYRDEAAALRADFVQVDTSMTFDRALVQYLIDRRRRC